MHTGKHRRQNLRFVGWFFLCNTLLFRLIGYGYLEKILLSPSLYENSLANYATISGKILIVVFAIVNPPFHKTIYQGINDLNLEGAPGNDVGDRDRYVTKQAIKFFNTRERKQPFFVHLFYNAPHGYCQSQS